MLTREEELFQALRQAVIVYDGEKCRDLCMRVLEEGIDAGEAILRGLAAGMERVGELYAGKEYFVPELLLCSDTLHAGLETLRPGVGRKESASGGKILLGVVQGDVHEIGKNLVKVMFEAAGWEVHDLGKDVELERFVEEQRRIGADVVGISALMTTSMLAIPKVIEAVKKLDRKVKTLAGGAPLNRAMALKFGADGYAPDASSAVREGAVLLADRTEERK